MTKKLSLTFFITAVSYIAGSYLLSFLLSEVWVPVYVSLLISQAFILVPACIYLRRMWISPRKTFQNRPISLAVIVLLVVFTLLLEPLLMFVNVVSQLFVESGTASLSTGIESLPLWSNLLFIALLPAVSEEFVCRGVYYHGYRESGVWKGILMSALIFGLLHLNLNQFMYTFLLGLILPVVVEAAGSVKAAVIVHLTFNGFSVLLSAALQRFSEDEIFGRALAQAGNMGSSAAQTADLLPLLVLLAGLAIFTTAAAMGVLYAISGLSGRRGYLSWLLFGKGRKTKAAKEQRSIDVWFCLGVLVCVIFIITELR